MPRREKEKSYAIRGALVCLGGIIGPILIAVAFTLPIEAGAAREHTQLMTALPDAHSAGTGATALVSGRISNQTPLLRGDFVAYRRQQVRGTYRLGTETVTIDSGTQPLTIETDAGPVRIVNNDYRFEDAHVEWAAAEAVDTPHTLTEAMIKIRGFQRSTPVVAVGRVEQAGEVVSVKAEFIVAGPRDAYLKRLGDASQSRVGTVLLIAAIGVLLLLYAVWEGRRIYRD